MDFGTENEYADEAPSSPTHPDSSARSYDIHLLLGNPGKKDCYFTV
jgi:hypothetical protein